MALLAAAVILLTSMQVEDETSALALQVGIDPVALQGAVATVQSTPQEYLRYEGLLEPPRLTALPGAATALWDRLAACEYRGGLQFDQQTWLSYGGGQYAASAHLASKAQQIVVAERLRSVRGLAPWPVCGRRV
jgi:hypothetical protein